MVKILFWEIPLPFLYSPQEDVWQSLWRCSVAEFMGTMIFVFLGTGSVVAAQAAGKESLLINAVPLLILVSLAHGFAITVSIYTIGDVSGGTLLQICMGVLLTTRSYRQYQPRCNLGTCSYAQDELRSWAYFCDFAAAWRAVGLCCTKVDAARRARVLPWLPHT